LVPSFLVLFGISWFYSSFNEISADFTSCPVTRATSPPKPSFFDIGWRLLVVIASVVISAAVSARFAVEGTPLANIRCTILAIVCSCFCRCLLLLAIFPAVFLRRFSWPKLLQGAYARGKGVCAAADAAWAASRTNRRTTSTPVGGTPSGCAVTGERFLV
jgi:hypothetical protein